MIYTVQTKQGGSWIERITTFSLLEAAQEAQDIRDLEEGAIVRVLLNGKVIG